MTIVIIMTIIWYMNKKMTRFYIVGGAALLLGGLIYLLLRPASYVARLFPEYSWLKALRAQLQWQWLDLLRYYFADYLWALSLCSGLHILFAPKRVGSFLCTGVTALYGAVLELLQFFGQIPGTGDLWDVVMFILAGLTATIINEKKEK